MKKINARSTSRGPSKNGGLSQVPRLPLNTPLAVLNN